MAKLSIVIPSRDEKYLTPTIDDIFRNARGEIEVIAVLDSDKWPGDWREVSARHPRLHTIHNGSPRGMRHSINVGVASAISRGAKYVAKFDGHCSFGEGFDEILKADMDADWIVVPRRKRLNPETWELTDTQKIDIDYHYLSFPDDPNDFGGPGLNGKPWNERSAARRDDPRYEIDDEMSSQGSGWAMHAEYFQRMGFMDEKSYGPFWNEFQELGLCCWLSGGQVKVNKRTFYSHWHKGKAGRGYRLQESWLTEGRNHTMLWPWNEAWDERQTLPFEWLIDHFWPVPSWPENWREILYAHKRPRLVGMGGAVAHGVGAGVDGDGVGDSTGDALQDHQVSLVEKPLGQGVKADEYEGVVEGLRIIDARYGVLAADGLLEEDAIDVTERVRSLVTKDSLDIIVNNSTLTPGLNPFRGVKKVLDLSYRYGNEERVRVYRQEKEALIIGQSQQCEPLLKCVQCGRLTPSLMAPNSTTNVGVCSGECADKWRHENQPLTRDVATVEEATKRPVTGTALNDFLIRRFNITPYRLRAPMPIELPNFHRNDLAQLLAELGFTRGAEIGVAEGNYSEVLLKANPTCELLLVDPWHAYSSNPQNKTKEKHEYAFNETLRKMKPYPNVTIMQDYSMNAVRAIADSSLDFVYIDGMHSFDYVMMDLISWSAKVRSGGIIALDDYYYIDRARWGAGVVEAVQAYTSAHQITPWFTCLGHKSWEAWWVKQ